MLRYVALIALFLAAPVVAQTPRADDQLTTLKLTESAQRAVKRDRLRAELRVEESGADPKRVQAEINRKMAAALEQARMVPAARVETGGYTVYREQPKNSGPIWRGQQSIALIGTAFDDVLSLAGALQQAGLVFSGMSFDLRPETARALEAELTAAAIARLQERAKHVAGELGLDVVRIREMRVGNALGDRPRPMMRMEMGAAAPPVAEAGEQIVEVSVEADVLLGTARGP
jgi:uncharacterized protein